MKKNQRRHYIDYYPVRRYVPYLRAAQYFGPLKKVIPGARR